MKGNFLKDKLNGPDCEVYFLDDGSRKYHGDMIKGLKHGQGQKYHQNGIAEYKGGFKNDFPHTDFGKLYDNEGNILYKGPIYMGKEEGYGQLYHSNLQQAYKGQFKNGMYDTSSNEKPSHGMLYDTDGFLYYMGGLKEGVLHGNGISYDKESGKLKYTGNFNNGIENDKENGICYYLNQHSSIKYVGGNFIN